MNEFCETTKMLIKNDDKECELLYWHVENCEECTYLREQRLKLKSLEYLTD